MAKAKSKGAATPTAEGVYYRSFRPRFGVRVAAGPEGKLMFSNVADTLVTDPDHRVRLASYVREGRIYVVPGPQA